MIFNGDYRIRGDLTVDGDITSGGSTVQKGPYAGGTVRLFVDEFERPDGDLDTTGTRWVDGSQVFPDSYEPLGILSGKVVIPDPTTRSGTYDTWPPSGHPPTLDRIHPGIACAWRETGSRQVRVKVRWSGYIGVGGASPHVEATPLLHVTPDNPLVGFGCWLSEFTPGLPFIIAGYITNPPEDFGLNVISTHAMTHTNETERDFELISDGEVVNAYLDGVLLTAWTTYGTDLPLNAGLKHSTMHGFAVDAHYTNPTLIPTTPAITRCEIEALDSSGWVSDIGDTINGELIVDTGVGRIELHDADGTPSVSMFKNDTDQWGSAGVGVLFGNPTFALGPGTSAVDAFLTRSDTGELGSGLGGTGLFHGGIRQTINNVDTQAYTTLVDDKAKTISRSWPTASTHVWPSDNDADINVGTQILVLNPGAGTITHSAGANAFLTAGSVTTQKQGQAILGIKASANTWSLTGVDHNHDGTYVPTIGDSVINTTSPGSIEISGSSGAPAISITKNDTDTKASVGIGSVLGIPFLGLGSGTADMDAFVGRAGINTVASGLDALGVFYGGFRQNINDISTAGHTVALSDRAKLISRTGTPSTQTWPSDASAAIDVGSFIFTVNRGSTDITHSAGTDAFIAAGSSTTQKPNQVAIAWKVSANTWYIWTPTTATHASTHATGGSDALTPANIGAVKAETSSAALWIGTQAQYDAVSPKVSTTVYIVEG